MIKLIDLLNEAPKSITNIQNGDPLEETNYPPKLVGLGQIKRGKFSVNSAANPSNKGIGCYFKRNTQWLKNMIKLATNTNVRKGLSNRTGKELGLIFSISAVKRNITTSPSITQDPLPPPTGSSKTIEITIDPLVVTDPFEFDKAKLGVTAQESIDKFINDILTVKQTHGDDIYTKYIQYLKDSKPQIVGYASRDGDPNVIVQGKYPGCGNAIDDNGKKTRAAYNKCLSQKRSEVIRDYIETKLTDLAGVFQPIGKGETTQYGGESWPDPSATSETSKPNRRFYVELPIFNSSRIIVTPPPPSPPSPPTPEPPKTKTKKTWNDWGVEFDTKNPTYLNVGQELNLPDHPNLEIPIAIDTNSGHYVIPIQILTKLKSRTGIQEFGYTQTIDLLSYMFNRDYTNTKANYTIGLTANSLTVGQTEFKKQIPFVFKTWVAATAGATNENLFIYLQTEESKLAILSDMNDGVRIGYVTPMIVDTALANF